MCGFLLWSVLSYYGVLSVMLWLRRLRTPNFCKAVAIYPVPQKFRKLWWRNRRCYILDPSNGKWTDFIYLSVKDGVMIREFKIHLIGFKPLVIFLPWYVLSEQEQVSIPWYIHIKEPVVFGVKDNPIIILVKEGAFALR